MKEFDWITVIIFVESVILCLICISIFYKNIRSFFEYLFLLIFKSKDFW